MTEINITIAESIDVENFYMQVLCLEFSVLQPACTVEEKSNKKRSSHPGCWLIISLHKEPLEQKRDHCGGKEIRPPIG